MLSASSVCHHLLTQNFLAVGKEEWYIPSWKLHVSIFKT
jgi:hypothetical protein